MNPIRVYSTAQDANVAEILIIDDHAGDRYIMAEALMGAGYQIRQANEGAKGLALCRERLPALVVTDIVMAVKDGIERSENCAAWLRTYPFSRSPERSTRTFT